MSKLVSDLPNGFFNFRGAQEMAAPWIDGSEQIAKRGLELQAKATEWSKNTVFATAFEIHHAMVRGWIEFSANAARRLWQLK